MPICLPTFAGVAQPASGGGAFSNNYSLSLDGIDDYATFTPGFIATTDDYTLSTWLNIDSIPGLGFVFIDPLLNALTINTNGNVFFETRTYSNYAFGSKTVITGASEDQWYHLAVVKQANVPSGSSTFTYYVDGSSVGTYVATLASSYAFGNQSGVSYLMQLGRYSGGGYFVNALIDEVAIFTSALDSTAISSIYNGGTPGDLRGLDPRNWYRMGDGTEGGSGATVYDMGASRGTTTDMALVNAVYSTDVP